MLESYIERRTCDLALELGVDNTKLQKATGYPDRIFWIPGGKPLLIEFKRPGEPPSEIQDYVIDLLRKLGYQVEVCDNVNDAIKLIIKALEAALISEEGRKILD
jgi:hypothetical protein